MVVKTMTKSFDVNNFVIFPLQALKSILMAFIIYSFLNQNLILLILLFFKNVFK